MNIKPKYHILKTSVVLISLLISTQNSQGRYTCIICHRKLHKDHCLLLQKQFWSKCRLEQSFTGNKITKATIKVFLICSVIALGLEEQIKIIKNKKNPSNHFLQTYMHSHTHASICLLNKDKESNRPLQCHIFAVWKCNLSENLAFYKVEFLYWVFRFASVWNTSPLTSTFSGLYLKWGQCTEHSKQLYSGIVKPRERAAVAASCKSGHFWWDKRNKSSQSTLMALLQFVYEEQEQKQVTHSRAPQLKQIFHNGYECTGLDMDPRLAPTEPGLSRQLSFKLWINSCIFTSQDQVRWGASCPIVQSLSFDFIYKKLSNTLWTLPWGADIT